MNNEQYQDGGDNQEATFTNLPLRSENRRSSAASMLWLSPKLCTWDLTLIGNILLLALLLLLSACSSASNPQIGTPAPTSQPVATLLPTPTPFTPIPTPTLKPPPLGPVPQNCPVNPPPHNVFSDVGPAYGSFPVWVIGLGYSPTNR